MNVVTKLNKTTGEKEFVSVKDFLNFVGNGAKKREEALTEIIEGGLYQNIDVAFFLAPLRSVDSTK
ncbi:hypothetical protein PN4B1_16620 [Paenibacillus naphthalenovorans]|uniref:hypothetical protein n=1 Tax=Paenibacillus naphthalenovorans TaxID=162209 RepID=UPI0010BC4C66|nr:hypothetical protein [Paenibacillus naphthalenovorans]GCL71757.1 hypothetical protein PN4B1_16620 [Paenibacillus naphthalenovorans]